MWGYGMLDVLQLIHLKSRPATETIACSCGMSVDYTAELLADLANQSLVEKSARGWRLTVSGIETLRRQLEEERQQISRECMDELYREFCTFNDAFKDIVTKWQMRFCDGEQLLNDHSDEAYDRKVVSHLGQLHSSFIQFLERLTAEVSRLSFYKTRFLKAWEHITAGDIRYIVGILIDSYHTIWFELHEELLQLSGRSRMTEEAAHA
jgi:pyruvate, orthophosphate dikinase